MIRVGAEILQNWWTGNFRAAALEVSRRKNSNNFVGPPSFLLLSIHLKKDTKVHRAGLVPWSSGTFLTITKC